MRSLECKVYLAVPWDQGLGRASVLDVGSVAGEQPLYGAPSADCSCQVGLMSIFTCLDKGTKCQPVCGRARGLLFWGAAKGHVLVPKG